jgi:UDP-2,3-diacylglucosamine hydrolase
MILDIQNKTNEAKYINLGDWISYFTYGVYDSEDFLIKTFED